MYAPLINLPPKYTPISAFPPPADFRTRMCSLSELLFHATKNPIIQWLTKSTRNLFF